MASGYALATCDSWPDPPQRSGGSGLSFWRYMGISLSIYGIEVCCEAVHDPGEWFADKDYLR